MEGVHFALTELTEPSGKGASNLPKNTAASNVNLRKSADEHVSLPLLW